MTAGEVFSSILSGVAVVLLSVIARGMLGVRKDFQRYMQEHMWLLATTLWTRDNVMTIMRALEMPITHEPPKDLPARRYRNGEP